MSRKFVMIAIVLSFLAGGAAVALTESHAAQPASAPAAADTPTTPATPVADIAPVPAPGAQPNTARAAAAVPPARPESFADLAAALQPAVVNISTTQTLGKKGAGNDGLQNPDGDDGNGGDDQGDSQGGLPGDDENGGDNAQPQLPVNPFPPGSPFEEFFKDFFDHQGQLNGGNGGGNNAAPRKATSLGSGFIYETDAAKGTALVVTNNHVVDNGEEIKVILSDNTKLDATLVGKDSKTDLALLRVKTPHKLTAVSWGDSDTARVGDWVLAIGNPFGLGGTVTAGIVSARARDINAGPYDDFIQTDASINRGNSGGPMFNMKGEVVGINTAIYSPSGGSVGIGFAIPANLAKPIVEQLKASGSIKRGWIGVRIQNVTDDIAQSLGLTKTTGALVSSVEDASPSAKAGIKAGDVILTFNGHEVTEMRRLPRMVAETALNATVPLTVWRNGHEVTLSIKIAELAASDVAAKEDKAETPASKATTLRVEPLGMKLAALAPSLRQRYQIDAKIKGVLVVEVDNVADAADKGIRPGDVIVEANQVPVTTPEEVASKVKDVPAGRPILLLVERSGDTRYVAVAIKK